MWLLFHIKLNELNERSNIRPASDFDAAVELLATDQLLQCRGEQHGVAIPWHEVRPAHTTNQCSGALLEVLCLLLCCGVERGVFVVVSVPVALDKQKLNTAAKITSNTQLKHTSALTL